MAHLIFRLRQVPDDEAADIRQLLHSAHIEYYETDAGNWGISMPGLWVGDETDAARARELIDGYQQERVERIRNSAQNLHEDTRPRTFIHVLRERPLYTTGLLLFCAALIYFMVKPFLALFANS